MTPASSISPTSERVEARLDAMDAHASPAASRRAARPEAISSSRASCSLTWLGLGLGLGSGSGLGLGFVVIRPPKSPPLQVRP